MQESIKPEGLLDAHLTFLDNLRKSGKINMTGAAIHLEKSFKLTADKADEILYYWMSKA